MSAVDEVCRMLTEKFVDKARKEKLPEWYIEHHKGYYAYAFRTATIHRTGFLTLLKRLKIAPSTKQNLVAMAHKGVIVEDPSLVEDYLDRFKDILFIETYGVYRLTPLGERLLRELQR